MLRRRTRTQDRAREALQEHWRVAEVAEQVETQKEEVQEVGANLVLGVLFGTTDVLQTC